MLMNKDIKESPFDPVLQEDLYTLIKGDLPIDILKNSTCLVSGATGLIGSQIVKLLACYNRLKDAQIKVIAYARSMEKAKSVFGDLLNRGDVVVKLGDINEPVIVEDAVDYIIHGASATSSPYFVTNPVETIMTAINGTRNMLEFARRKAAKGFVYLSSLEVYGVPSKNGLIEESDYGYIDPLSVRSSYSESKRMVECLCISYGQEYNIPVKIARLSQTFGAGVEYDDGRVFAEFARCVIEKRNIILHTAGNTVRSYCYTADTLSAILYILAFGKCGEAYNVTNMDTAISIRDMAQLVCDIFANAGISVNFDMPRDLESFGFNPEMVIKMDSSRLTELGWKPVFPLAEMYKRMVCSMMEK